MTNKRAAAALLAVLLLCAAIYCYLKLGFSSDPTSPSTSRISQFKTLIDRPVAPERVKRARDLIFAMGNERQSQELLEVKETLEAMRVIEPELWGSLGFVLMVSTANINREDVDWRWRWVRQSLVVLRKGVDVTGGHLDVANDLAHQLQSVAESGDSGRFETALISRFESDSELQQALRAPGEMPEETPSSPFIVAMGWRNHLKNSILVSQDPNGHTTKDGMRLTPLTQEGFLRFLAYAEGIYQWQQANYQKATHWLTIAEDKCDLVIRMDPQASPKFKDWKVFARDLRAVVLLDQRASDKALSGQARRSLLEEKLKHAQALFANAKDQQARSDLDWGHVQAFIAKWQQALK